MRASDPAAFLVGSRGAIERLAATPGILWVGALLVLTATVARNYDQEDMIANWPVWLHGFGVSAANAFVIWSLLYLRLRNSKQTPGYWRGYVVFLGLFWMTAPLAWLYAIPYERMMSPVDAVHANADTLAVVAVWRVLLITRVLTVVWGAGYVRVLLVVWAIGDVIVALITAFTPFPMVDVMGGTGHSTAIEERAALSFMVMGVSVLAAPVLGILAIIALVGLKGSWRTGPRDGTVPRSASVATAAALVVSAVLWFVFQPQQRLKTRMDALIRSDLHQGLMELARFTLQDFPVDWDPPPRVRWGEHEPTLEQVRDELALGGQPAWIRKLYLRKSWSVVHYYSDEPPAELLDLYKRLRRGPEPSDREIIRFHIEHDETFTDEERESFQRLLEDPEERRQ